MRRIEKEDVTSGLPTQIHSTPSSNVADNCEVDQLLNNDNYNDNDNDDNDNDKNDDHIDIVQPQENPNDFPSVQQDFCTTRTVDVDKEKDIPFLCPPLDKAEQAHLEWLSKFLHDSFSPYSTPYPDPAGYPNPKPQPTPNSIEQKPAEENTSPLSLKRATRGKRVLTVPESESYYTPRITSHSQGTKRRKQAGVRVSTGTGIQRRCSHCGVQKTPHRRQGPNGPKSLCNACGVRFKSGRLLPEYRPASSPSFSSELHCNSHKKVMDMRKKEDKDGDGSDHL